ncbi:MAG: hypothetical protein H0V17_09275 [Deltaproteobacteria bacterium]|nr:hypothetical protein [Deltaproteobacteria bacterium]
MDAQASKPSRATDGTLAAIDPDMDDHLSRLLRKLSRELAQSEQDAMLHTVREASRLGEVPPAAALRAIAAHAEHLRPRLDALLVPQQPLGVRIGRLVGRLFSDARHYFVDRVLSAERSYRATLLGLLHGVDTARLLREVAHRSEEIRLFRLCDDLIAQREPLIREAERALAWFAVHPDTAMMTGARLALESAPSDPVAQPVSPPRS